MKTKADSKDPNRQLGEPFTCRYWQDNHEQIMEISENTGRSAREIARDLMDDALRRRLSGAETTAGNNEGIIKKIDPLIEQNREMAERYEQILRRYEQLAERSENLRGRLIQNLHEFYAILHLLSLRAEFGANEASHA